MASEQFELFVILLKLKSFLVSMVDDPALESGGFEFTEEYLVRKYPDRKAEVIEMLLRHNIESDYQITFDENIQNKFKEMVLGIDSTLKLREILDKYQIKTEKNSLKEKTLDEIRKIREQNLNEIISILLQLARIWTKRNEIESNIEDYSLLDEEDLIRPEELKELGELDQATSVSYKTIAKLTEIYLEQLADYYFKFGGDIALNRFINNLDFLKNKVSAKYKDLLDKLGNESNKLQ